MFIRPEIRKVVNLFKNNPQEVEFRWTEAGGMVRYNGIEIYGGCPTLYVDNEMINGSYLNMFERHVLRRVVKDAYWRKRFKEESDSYQKTQTALKRLKEL